MASATNRRIAGATVMGLFALFLLTSPIFFLTSGYRLDVARLALYVGTLAAIWSLLAGIGGQFSFAHIAIAGLGAYASAIWVRDVSGAVGSIWVGILFGTAFAWIVGTLLGMLLLRLRAAYLALFTIAFAEMARLAVVAESDLTGGRLSLAVKQLPGGETAHHYLMLALLGLILGLIYLLLDSRFGLFLRAMRDDEGAAAAMGVDVVRMKVLVFSITSLMVGFTATVYTHTTMRLAPERLDLLFMSQVIAVAVIGGLESPVAASIGALIVFGLLENLRRIEVGPGGFDALTILVAAVLLLIAWIAKTKATRPTPAVVRRQVPWLVLGMLLTTTFLYSVGATSGVGTWLSWGTLAAGTLATTRYVSRSHAQGVPAWYGPQASRLAILATGSALLARMVTGTSINIELGVWRFGVFGAVLILTLRFSRNGLIQPVLSYFFSGRHEARAATVAGRDLAGVGDGTGEGESPT